MTHNFYFKIFIKSLIAFLIAYSFMLVQYWWGNHDWTSLKETVKVVDGVFEARYSQHLPTVFLFEGHILPILINLFTLSALAVCGILITKYLEFPQNEKTILLCIFLLFINPHTPILFYYVFISFPLIFWSAFGVSLLFLSEKEYCKSKFFFGSLGYTVLLGSYPPNISLICTLFVGRRLFCYINNKQSFRQILINGVFFASQLVTAFIFYLGIIKYLQYSSLVNQEMYNIQTRTTPDMFFSLLKEFPAFFAHYKYIMQNFGKSYALFFTLVSVSGLVISLLKASNKLLILLFWIGIILSMRIPFILSENAYLAQIRVTPYGEIGLIAICLRLILLINLKEIQNIFYLISCAFLWIFICYNFDIQKVQYLAFRGERLYHQRLVERISLHPNFDYTHKYVALNLGYPDFQQHFLKDGYIGVSKGLLDNSVLPADLTFVLFSEDSDYPITIKLGVWGERLWIVQDGHLERIPFVLTETNQQNLRWWFYQETKQYPHPNSVYVDDILLFLNLNDTVTNRSKELILNNLFSMLIGTKSPLKNNF